MLRKRLQTNKAKKCEYFKLHVLMQFIILSTKLKVMLYVQTVKFGFLNGENVKTLDKFQSGH